MRIAILIAAIAALALAMCAHSRPPATPANAAAPSQQPAPAPDAAAQPPQTARPEYFPATKAPARIY